MRRSSSRRRQRPGADAEDKESGKGSGSGGSKRQKTESTKDKEESTKESKQGKGKGSARAPPRPETPEEEKVIGVDVGVPESMDFDHWLEVWERRRKRHRKEKSGLVHAMKQYNEFIKGNVRRAPTHAARARPRSLCTYCMFFVDAVRCACNVFRGEPPHLSQYAPFLHPP